MDFLKLTKSSLQQLTKLFLLPVITIVIVVGLSAKFLLPKVGDIQKILLETQKINQELASLESKAGKLNELKNSSLTADFQQMEMLLPSEKNIMLIFSTLGNLEKRNNVTIERLSVKPGLIDKGKVQADKKTKTGSEDLSFSFSVTGTQDSVNQFLEDLLATAPIFTVNKVNLAINSGIVDATIDVATYFQSLPETLGNINTPLSELSATQKKTLEIVKRYNAVDTSLEEISEEESASPSALPKVNKGIFNL